MNYKEEINFAILNWKQQSTILSLSKLCDALEKATTAMKILNSVSKEMKITELAN